MSTGAIAFQSTNRLEVDAEALKQCSSVCFVASTFQTTIFKQSVDQPANHQRAFERIISCEDAKGPVHVNL